MDELFFPGNSGKNSVWPGELINSLNLYTVSRHWFSLKELRIMNDDTKESETLPVFNTVLLCATLVFLVYFNSLGGEFVFDDRTYVIANYLIKNFDLQNLREIFTSFYGWDYLPLTLLSLNVDYMIWGLNPFGYHLTNLLLHLLNGLILHRLVYHLVRSRSAALWVALLFLVHPVHVESVAWISERKNVLSMFFLLLAFYRYRISGPGLGSVFLFLSACLAKSSAVTFPLLLVLNDFCFSRKPRTRIVSDSTPYFLIALVVSAVTLMANIQGGTIREHQEGNIFFTAISMIVVFKEYLAKFLVPVNLNVWYPNPLVASLSAGQLVFSFLMCGFFLAALAASWKNHKIVFFGLSWFAVTLLPVSHIVPIPQMMADRFLYLPSIGGILAFVSFLRTFWKPRFLIRRLFLIGIVSGFVILDMNRVPVFHQDLVLWQDSVRKDANNTIAMMYLGLAYWEKGEWDKALEKLALAREIDPNNFKAGRKKQEDRPQARP
ncbi:hypothetical protein UR09_06070 [Candidatus Nitromaritima sp. SCGC AAA799-A02]|nr:hypothetical protein UR09_06070 [Candidatus Nitromaritima sp. SCGC AAA799-A02]